MRGTTETCAFQPGCLRHQQPSILPEPLRCNVRAERGDRAATRPPPRHRTTLPWTSDSRNVPLLPPQRMDFRRGRELLGRPPQHRVTDRGNRLYIHCRRGPRQVRGSGSALDGVRPLPDAIAPERHMPCAVHLPLLEIGQSAASLRTGEIAPFTCSCSRCLTRQVARTSGSGRFGSL